jgi:uncharacterized membrane protein
MGLAACLIGAAGLLNPWWGLHPGPATGWPLFNLLLCGFAAPAAAGFAHWQFWRARNAPALARLSLLFAAGMSGLWVVLEVRRSFVGAALDLGALGWPQTAAYALIAGLVIGGCFYLWPRQRSLLQPTEPQQA